MNALPLEPAPTSYLYFRNQHQHGAQGTCAAVVPWSQECEIWYTEYKHYYSRYSDAVEGRGSIFDRGKRYFTTP